MPTRPDFDQRITALETSMSQIAVIAEMAQRHEGILKGGDRDSDKGLLERVRRIEDAINAASGWMRAIVLLFIGQFITVVIGVLAFFIKISPALLALSK